MEEKCHTTEENNNRITNRTDGEATNIRKDFSCKVSEVFSPESFYVQVQSKEEELNNLLTEINDFYNHIQVIVIGYISHSYSYIQSRSGFGSAATANP